MRKKIINDIAIIIIIIIREIQPMPILLIAHTFLNILMRYEDITQF